MARKPKDSGGGKLGRSETVTIRLDPRLNYLCELAARSQRRTKSSFIEAVIDEAIRRVKLDPADTWDKAKTVGSEARILWSVREPERVSALAYLAPHLMTYEEQQIWAVVRENGYFWRGRFVDDGEEEVWVWDCSERSLLSDRLAQHWDRIVAVANGEAAVTTLPPWQHKRPSESPPDNDPLDDEPPF